MRKGNDSVGFKILSRMKRGSPSRIWTTSEFVHLGTRTAIDVALHRLQAKDLVRRLSPGLYHLPRFDGSDVVPPNYRSVLAAVRRRDRVEFLIDERSAAQHLGLAPGTPTASLSFLTSGQVENIALGNRTIRFRKVAPRRMFWAGRPAACLVQAMRYLRKEFETNSALLPRLAEILDAEGGDAIRRDLQSGLGELPDWLIPHVKKLLRASA
jgi:hypothetical protein